MDRAEYDRIPELALEWHAAGKGAVIASVIETWGSAPRPVGSQLAISGAGEMAGSVSGGCVEGAVVAEAADVLASGVPKILSFDVSDDDAFAVGLACGGKVRVLVEPVGDAPMALAPSMLAALVEARVAGKALAYTVDLESWARALCPRGAAHEARFRADKSGIEENLFVAIHNPALRLIIVGAVHIAQALVPMARACGFAPILIDPRGAFGSAARFPGERILDDWPDEALASLHLDARTALVTLTHDPKLDDPAIIAALGSDVFYLGCLGSKRSHAKRIERLQGVSAEALARIHAPVGLAIGAQSPAEIALSIMAEITQVLRQGAAQA